MSLHKLSDNELVILFHAGDVRSFDVIYNRFQPWLYGQAIQMIEDGETAKDLVQDVFIVFYKSRKLYEPLKCYLLQMLRYKVSNYRDWYKRQWKGKRNYYSYLEISGMYIFEVQENLLREKELKQMLARELDLLPPSYKAVFELSRQANLSYETIARLRGTTIETVRRQIHIAIKRLREKISNQLC